MCVRDFNEWGMIHPGDLNYGILIVFHRQTSTKLKFDKRRVDGS